MLRNQLRFRCQPIPHIVARLRTGIHVIEVCLLSNLACHGCEILCRHYPCRARGIMVWVRDVIIMFHDRILSGISADIHGVLPDHSRGRTIGR